ncbi:unnamed protein product [Effrenium voratum]|nr:unnamed protein product [Effrenium voratum]
MAVWWLLSTVRAAGHFVQVPGESDASLFARWPGPISDPCLEWAEGAEGYELRRLATRRAKFFSEARDAVLRTASGARGGEWQPVLACPATGWTLRILNASAFADGEEGEAELALVVREVLMADESLLQTLSSRLSLFGLLALAGRRKRQRQLSTLSPVIWDTFTDLPRWSSLQSELWKAIRTRRPLPMAATILEMSSGPDGLKLATCLLASAQEIRLRSGDIISGAQTFSEVRALVGRAGAAVSLWASQVPLDELDRGLRDWPLVQLLADLEVSDLAQLHAMGRQLVSQQMVRFLPSPEVVPSIVLPYREPLSDHDRDIGRFHCTSDFFTEVEFWLREYGHLPEARMVAVEVACWLPDCLIWAAHRVGGRISAACLEADDLAVATGRRSIKLNGFEGQVHMLQRRVTGSLSACWHCRDHTDMQHPDNLEANAHLSNDRRCWFHEATGMACAKDHFASSIDTEVSRLGFQQIDILKMSISSMDILRSSSWALQRTQRVLLATDPRDTLAQVELLRDAGFEEIHVPMPHMSGGSTPYSFYIIARRLGV